VKPVVEAKEIEFTGQENRELRQKT